MGIRGEKDIWAISPTKIRGESLGKLRQNGGRRGVGMRGLVGLGCWGRKGEVAGRTFWVGSWASGWDGGESVDGVHGGGGRKERNPISPSHTPS